MQVRNLMIAAGAALAGLTAIAAAPTAANAQTFYRPAYHTPYFRYERAREIRRIEVRRAEERRLAELRFHRRFERRW